MNRIVIIDFNRTLYDPDRGRLMPFVRFVLRTLRQRGFTLVLISRAAPSRRALLKVLGIQPYFHRILLVDGKKGGQMRRIVSATGVERTKSYVVGDRVREEIQAGNDCGLQTIWIRSGKFKKELPRTPRERPTHTVWTLRDVLRVIH